LKGKNHNHQKKKSTIAMLKLSATLGKGEDKSVDSKSSKSNITRGGAPGLKKSSKSNLFKSKNGKERRGEERKEGAVSKKWG